MNNLMVFQYGENEIRTVTLNGDPWWVAKDVCDVFGETNRNRAMQALDEDEKGYTQTNTPGGLQQLAVVNESGLYALLFAMQPTKARGVDDTYITERQQKLNKFKRWVTHEVLPAIRKTGGYISITSTDNDADIMARALVIANRTIEEREKRLTQLNDERLERSITTAL